MIAPVLDQVLELGLILSYIELIATGAVRSRIFEPDPRGISLAGDREDLATTAE